MADFGLCVTCPEMTTGRFDSSKGFLLDASSNHNTCEVIPLAPSTMTGPMRHMVLKLGAGAPITDTDITMFKLGYEMSDAWKPKESPSLAQDAGSSSEGSPAPVLVSGASTRSQPASASTSTIAARNDGMLW